MTAAVPIPLLNAFLELNPFEKLDFARSFQVLVQSSQLLLATRFVSHADHALHLWNALRKKLYSLLEHLDGLVDLNGAVAIVFANLYQGQTQVDVRFNVPLVELVGFRCSIEHAIVVLHALVALSDGAVKLCVQAIRVVWVKLLERQMNKVRLRAFRTFSNLQSHS